MKKILPFLVLTISSLFFPANTHAIDPVDVPVASAEAILDATKKEILKKALDKNLDQTEKVLAEESTRPVGYAGTISDIKQGVFTLESGSVSLQVSFDTKTTIVKDGQTLKPELISIKDKAIVIGNLTGPEIIAAKRIVIYKEVAPKSSKKIVFSPIVKIDIKKKTITLKINDKNQEVTLGKLIKLDFATLTLDQKIFGVLLINTDGAVTLIQAKVI